jgi:hypothetical protein
MTNTLNLPRCLFLKKFISGSEYILCNICSILNLFVPYNICFYENLLYNKSSG